MKNGFVIKPMKFWIKLIDYEMIFIKLCWFVLSLLSLSLSLSFLYYDYYHHDYYYHYKEITKFYLNITFVIVIIRKFRKNWDFKCMNGSSSTDLFFSRTVIPLPYRTLMDSSIPTLSHPPYVIWIKVTTNN